MTSIANHLLSIYAGARGSANTWVNRPNRSALYGGRPPIEVMTAGSTQDLIRVPADLPPLPLSNLSEDARFLDMAALLLGAADSADAGGIPGTARRNATPEASALVASFLFPGASRFSDGSFGLYYAAKDIHTAIAETVHHDVRRLRDMDESVSLDRQVLIAPIEGKVRSLVGRWACCGCSDHGQRGRLAPAWTSRGCVNLASKASVTRNPSGSSMPGADTIRTGYRRVRPDDPFEDCSWQPCG